MVKPPKYVREVLKTIEGREYLAYLVGGCVRDMFMDRQPHDWDVATDAAPEVIQALFSRTVPTGIRHGTVTVVTGHGNVEVTTFRKEGGYIGHRRPESVSYVADLTQDLSRRDFTVNAIAVPLGGIVTDPFGGLDDIEGRCIRCVGDPDRRFGEDALRMLRALRFSAVLEFTIEGETAEAIRRQAHLVESLSAERVRDEIEKILLSKHPGVLGDVLDWGLLSGYVRAGRAVDRARLERLGRIHSHKFRRWAALAAVLESCGAIDSPLDFLRALRLDKKTVGAASMGAEIAKGPLPEDRRGWKLLLWRYGTQTVICAAAAAEVLGRTGCVKAVDAVIHSGECFSLKRLAVGGDDLIALGLRPGAQVGSVLEQLLRHVIEHPEDNRKNVLIALAACSISDSVPVTR